MEKVKVFSINLQTILILIISNVCAQNFNLVKNGNFEAQFSPNILQSNLTLTNNGTYNLISTNYKHCDCDKPIFWGFSNNAKLFSSYIDEAKLYADPCVLFVGVNHQDCISLFYQDPGVGAIVHNNNIIHRKIEAENGYYYVFLGNMTQKASRANLIQYFDCKLNTGNYHASYYLYIPKFWSKNSKINLVINNRGVVKRDRVDNYNMWEHKNGNFSLNDPAKNYNYIEFRANIPNGRTPCCKQSLYDVGFGNNFTLIDNISLTRPCDEQNVCSRTSGQICPSIVNQITNPDVRFVNVSNIHNVSRIDLKIINSLSQTVFTKTYQTINGFSDGFYWNGRNDNGQIIAASSVKFEYEITFHNDCGSTSRKGELSYINTTLNAPPLPNEGSNWTKTPKPCCVAHIHIPDNTVLTGNITFHATQLITVGNNVTVAPNSNVQMIAPTVDLGQSFQSLDGFVQLYQANCKEGELQEQFFAINYDTIPILTFPEGMVYQDEDTLDVDEEELENDNGQKNSLENSNQWKEIYFKNFSIYPNPFQQEVKIQFSLYQNDKMKIQIFNSMGNLIENICNRSLEAGNHEFTWKPNNIPSGTYFIRFETQNQTWTEKIIYLP